MGAHSERSFGFSAAGPVVLKNCEFSHLGICFHPPTLAAFAQRVRGDSLFSSPSLCACPPSSPSNRRVNRCAFNELLQRHLKVSEPMPSVEAICYHTRLSAQAVTLQGRLLPSAAESERREKVKRGNERRSTDATSGAETMFLVGDDDEYAGLPAVPNV